MDLDKIHNMKIKPTHHNYRTSWRKKIWYKSYTQDKENWYLAEFCRMWQFFIMDISGLWGHLSKEFLLNADVLKLISSRILTWSWGPRWMHGIGRSPRACLGTLPCLCFLSYHHHAYNSASPWCSVKKTLSQELRRADPHDHGLKKVKFLSFKLGGKWKRTGANGNEEDDD